jgi:hypothetical protein
LLGNSCADNWSVQLLDFLALAGKSCADSQSVQLLEGTCADNQSVQLLEAQTPNSSAKDSYVRRRAQ